jgi:tetratricopeptide (TPR) repeat protein
MNSARLEMLRRFTEEDPREPFNWYALALEYLKSNPEKALNLFDKLLADFEEYLPTYYMAANQYAYLGNIERATELFKKGIQLAKRMDDQKTAGELESALEEILFT